MNVSLYSSRPSRCFLPNYRFTAQSFAILRNAVASTAFHNSGDQFDPPKCHHNTRIAVLQKIKDWILRCDPETWDGFIMWLTGAAGAGKSSIAQSIIELYQREGRILGSFFFGKSDPTRNHGRPLVATLAYQMYFALPEIQARLIQAIDSDPLIFTRSIAFQFKMIILEPLHDLFQSEGHYLSSNDHDRLIIIDGLDECIDRKTQCQILNMIANGVHQFRLPIIFLVASRPEHDIQTVFTSKAMRTIHTRLVLDAQYLPDDDIRVFLRDSFERIKEEHPYVDKSSPSWEEWPGEEVICSLVMKSSGQFVYAATVIKFVESIRHRPDHRLEIILRLRPPDRELPFAELDALYIEIFSSIDPDSVEKVLQVFGLIFIWSAQVARKLLRSEIELFLGLYEGESWLLFCDLGSLVTFGDVFGNEYISILHASLLDFFLDPSRSRQFYINMKTETHRHVINCFRHIPCLGMCPLLLALA